MKKINKYIATTALLVMVVTLFVACEKTFDEKLGTNDDLSNSTVVQVFNAVVNSNRTQVYVDGIRISGATIAQGTVFPTTNTGVDIKGGLRAFLVRDTISTSTPQVPLSFAENMQVDRHQTIFVYDTITSPKQKTVIDNIEIPTDTTARIRFANFVYNAGGPPPAIDVYSVKRGENIFTNLQVTDVSPFIPFASALTDTLVIRPTGTTTNLQNLTTSTWNDIRMIFTPTIRRSYTIVFWGSYQTTNTASAFERQLALVVNR